MPFRAFVSSTYLDLKDHRAHAISSLRRAGFAVDPMQDWTVDSDEPKEFYQDILNGCDLCVLLVAFRRGYVPDGQTLSITQLEYEAAVKRGIDILPFMLDENAPWPRKFDESQKDPEIVKWRAELQMRHGVQIFGLEPRSIDMTGALGRWLAKRPAQPPAESQDVRSRQQFDVFFSYNSDDRVEVRQLADRLDRDGIHVWMDLTALKGGDDWARETQAAFERADVISIFVGAAGIGKQQNAEVEKALERKSKPEGGFRVIPVLLPGANLELLPPALAKYFWVDFRDSLDNPEAYSRLKSAILERRVSPPEAASRLRLVIDEDALEMLPELLFRLVARLRERPEMLRSLDATAFWAAVRKIQPGASTIEDLRSLNAQLSSEAAPSAIWTAWIKNTRAMELTALLQHPDVTEA